MQNRSIDIEALVRHLAARVHSPEVLRADNPTWTRCVKDSITELLASEGNDVTDVLYSNPLRHNHEFLLDLIVWDRSNGEGVLLAAESEWNQDVASIVEDFWKLLVVKAPVKLMVFALTAKPRKHTQDKVWEEIEKAFLLYRDHVKGERYIFINFAPDDAQSAWWLEVEEDGKLSHLPDRKFIDL